MRFVAALAVALAVALSFALAPARPANAAEWTGRYSFYDPGSFSGQVNRYSCVGASVQMMLNLIFDQSDQSATRQKRYWRYAQNHSKFPNHDNGADPRGWALALQNWGAGAYTVSKAYTLQASLRVAARRMRASGKPVGLLVWHGGHSWVMTGFEASADPARTDDYRVTAIQAMGPLWPSGTINGRSFDPGPKTWLGLRALKQKFTAYQVAGHGPLNGRWITVVP
jgi:hypothetical protein